MILIGVNICTASSTLRRQTKKIGAVGKGIGSESADSGLSMNRKKRMGAITEPWETPALVENSWERTAPTGGEDDPLAMRT